MLTVAILILICLLLVSCGSKSKSFSNSAFLMGTVTTEKIYCDSTVDGERVLNELEKCISDCEKEISWRIAGSDTAELNETGRTYIHGSEDLWVNMIELYKDTCGRFDITIGKLTTLWNIGTEDARVPSEEEISHALLYVDGSKLKLDREKGEVTCGEEQFIDLGAVGKGYACDKAREVLVSNNIEGACIAVGGSILCYGEHEGKETYSIGIRDPNGDINDCMAVIDVSDCVVSTSGDYEHVFEKNGCKYHHIIDSKTGHPVTTDLTSVTVISKSGILSDALSTACFIVGEENGRELLEKYESEGIFVYKDMGVSGTDGINIKLKGEYHEKSD